MKQVKILACAFMLTVCIGLITTPVRADSNEVVTLSGHIDGDYYCEGDVDKLILAGVDMDEGSVLYIETETVLEIADNTENNLYSFEADGMVDITGGGTLNISRSMLAMGYDVIFNHTGEINITGCLAGGDGNLIFNSGRTNVTVEKEGFCGVTCNNSEFILNGGELNVSSKSVGIMANKGLYLNGGTLDVQSEIALGTDNETAFQFVDDMNPEGTQVSSVDHGYGPVYLLTDAATGENIGVISVSAKDAKQEIAESKKEFATKTEEVKEMRAQGPSEAEDITQDITEDETPVQSRGVSPAIIIVVIVGIAVAVGILAAMAEHKKKKRGK